MPYIDVNKLCELVEYSKYNNPHSGELRFNHRTEHDHFFRMIMSVPVEDVTKVVHGRWRIETDEEEPRPMFKLVVCSVCEEKANHPYNYCPNCGAKMDLEE